MRPAFAIPLLAAVVLSGCTAGGASPSAGSPGSAGASPSTSRASSDAPGPTTPPPGIPATQWRALLDDLAARGVPIQKVEVVSSRSVTWPDGSLGCPKPGRLYTQSLIDGYQVVVKVGERTYDYRFGASTAPQLCEP